jgi:hypothetical protein
MDNTKKYNVLENVLQKVNQKYIAAPDDEIKRNNRLLEVVDRIIQMMRSKNTLFDNLFQSKFYGGSYYDNLKVGNPSEYDLDCLLSLPKAAEPTIEVSDVPGYVHVTLNMAALYKKKDEAPKYLGLESLLDGNRLCTKKIKSWMEGLMSSVLTKNSKMKVTVDDTTCVLEPKVRKSGPALTIKLQGCYKDKDFDIDIDLVPCFTFFDEHWPKKGYRENKTQKNTFFVVPKTPSDDQTDCWRLSFQEQERQLISNYAVMKPTIRLIKKIRDRHDHTKIASYFIKTIFLWELENLDPTLWSKSLSFVFVVMLKKYMEYVEKGNIPYYWNAENNLIEKLSSATTSGIANKLKNIVDHIEKICINLEVYGILHYFLKSEEYDIETFKKEVPLSKKQLRQADVARISSQQTLLLSDGFFLSACQTVSVDTALSSSSSSSSSFEEINKDMVKAPTTSSSSSEDITKDMAEAPTTTPDLHQVLSRLEAKIDTLISEQKRFFQVFETAVERISSCEARIKEIADTVDNSIGKVVTANEELRMKIGLLERKIDELPKKVEPSMDPMFLLDESDKLGRTVEFLQNHT